MRRTRLLACSLVLGLTACGGGGGGGGGETVAPPPPATPLVYTGATTAATITAANAATVASNVMGASGAAANGSLTGVSATASASAPQPTGVTGLARRLTKDIRADDVARAGSAGALTGAAIDQTQACDSGTVHIVGTVSDTNGTGTVNVTYSACRTGSDTINGPASLKIDATQNGHITDSTLSITRVTFTGPGINSDLTGTLRSQIDLANQTETLTENIITKDNTTGHMTQTQNLVIFNQYDSVTAPTFFTESITGRVFDSVSGYVDVTTSFAPHKGVWGPLYFSTSTQSFPDWGIINLAGATSNVRITSMGSDLAKVQVDTNGDGTFENTARLRWADMNTAIGSDLADTDGDGMHNSWETANGLNPNANDAAADSDSDGYTNLVEYLNGSAANTNGSVPSPVHHVWVNDVNALAADVNGTIDVFTGADSGVRLDPVTQELEATDFVGLVNPNNATTRTTAPDAQGNTYTLAQPTADTTVLTLTSSTGTTITLTNIAGTDAGALIRYGTRGLAFRTVGAKGPGYVYLVESPVLIP